MKPKSSYLFAGALVLVIIIWFVIGGVGPKDDTPPAPVITAKQDQTPIVKTKHLTAVLHENFLDLYGQTQAVREVSVKAETAGLVARTPVKEGTMVAKGTLLCQQKVDARQAQLDQANALLRTRELEFEASRKLVEKGFRSSTQNASAQAALDGARASVKQAEIELANVDMRAPFGGIFETRMAEIGDYLGPGQACGLLVDMDPLIVVGKVTENDINGIQVGQVAQVSLVTGENLTGKVRYIETRADPATRTFHVEIEIPNQDAKLKAGISSTIRLLAGQAMAHYIPASVLTLGDNGVVGARYVDDMHEVHFTPVQTIDEDKDGIWVTGLPSAVDLIVLGQDFVDEGVVVKTQYNDQTPWDQ